MPDTIQPKKYSYLALGDSYTIGESITPGYNFPNQVTKMMQRHEIIVEPARIIAQTGWTTGELKTGIGHAVSTGDLSPSYDFVSLLIGVNNQYRQLPADQYKVELEELVQIAIGFAGNRADHVVLLSIPDWGVTPYAEGRDRSQIALEIDVLNAINKAMALRYNIYYIDITPWTREAALDQSLLATDGLHPSGREYQRWAERVASFFISKL